MGGAMMQKKEKADSGVTSALKEQLALITFVVLFAGLVSTETYYAGFGVRYQLLELSITHLVYRGLTAAIDSAWLIIVYVLAIGWLSFGAEWTSGRSNRWAAAAQPISYVLVILIAIVAYMAAISAGARAANLDLRNETSRLPVVREIKDSSGKPLPFAGYRLLMAGKDTVVLFRATSNDAESPFIHLLKRDETGEITITR